MTLPTDNWRKIFGDLTTDGVYEMCEINAYQLASHLEELYLLNQELQDRVKALEGQQINYEGCYD